MKKIVSLFLMFAMSMTMWATKTLYFVPNSNWTQANAKFAVYYFGGTGEAADGWSEFMTAVENETNLYTTTIPDGYPTVIFCRMNPAQADRNWNNKWNQTANITLPTDGKNLFTLADGWDQINGTWSTYGAVEPQPIDTTVTPVDTTVVPQPVEEHYYLVGAFNNWNATEAIEFQNADSMYTLSIAALEGEFKVIDAQDWNHGIYGFYTNDYQMPLGSEYNLLAGNQSENIQLDGAYTNVVLNLTKANDVLTLHFVAGTLVEDTTAQPVDTTVVPKFYITGNAALVGQDLEWNPAAIPSMTETYTLNLLADIDYVLKVTLNGTWVGENNVKGYNELTSVTPGLQNIGNDHNIGFKLAADGEVTVIYNDSTFEVLGNFVTDEPQPVEEHYYLIGSYNEWDVETALEFTNNDSLFTITIDSLFGEFKVMTARDWSKLSYGRGDNDGVVALGEPYTMVAWAGPNMSVANAYTNAVLNITKDGDNVLLTLVSGTEVVEPVAPANYYIKNNWNGGEWAWQQMIPANDGLTYGYVGVFGGTGVNINSAATDEGAEWFAVEAFYTEAGYEAQAGDTIQFVFNPADTTLTAILIGRPEAVVTPKFYITGNAALVGQDLEWNPAAIPSMTETYTLNLLADIDYVLKVTLNGTWVGENNVKGYNELTSVTPGLQNIGNDHNIGFKLAADGEVTVIYNDSTFEVLGNFVTDEPQPVEEHYYLIGSYNEWDVETALEFTNNDSLFTITIDSLFGEFKVMTARDWSKLSYGRGDNDGVVALGEPYTMVAWAGPNMSVANAYTNAVLNITKDGDNVLLTFVSGTLVEDPIIPEAKDTYFIKNNWNGGEWAWEQMEAANADSTVWTYTGVFGGTGVNINIAATDEGADWFTVDAMTVVGTVAPEANDTVLFTYNVLTEALTAEVLNRPGTGLENVVMDSENSFKSIENGVLYIYRNGVKYNAAGQIVR